MGRLFIKITFCLVCSLMIFFQSRADSAVIHVKPEGNDANSGASWGLAKKTVQNAINAANEGDELWVAAGTYPEHLHNRLVKVEDVDVAINAALYGGFAGTETTRDQRNWNLNLTILDGTNNGSVVTLTAGATQATRVDGFVITRGKGPLGGGGVYIEHSGPVITNNVIKENAANIGAGVGIYNYRFSPADPPVAHPVISNNRIIDNYAIEGGGGIAVVGNRRLVSWDPVRPIISGNTISGNISEYTGGGIGSYGHSSPYIVNNKIVANIASYQETNAVGKGGGIYATTRDVDDTPIEFAVSAPTIANNVIGANNCFLGAGICVWDTDRGVPTITNNTIFANNGIGLYWLETSPVIRNNIVAFNAWGLQQPKDTPFTATISHNCVYGNTIQGEKTDYMGFGNQTGSNGNIYADPRMANYWIGRFHVQPGSPCVDAGLSGALEAAWTDIDGQNRVIGGGVDIGADESDGTAWDVPRPVIYVRPIGNDAQDGLSWATAKRTVAVGIAGAAATGGELWVAAGTYAERVRIPAFVYLYGGFSGSETSWAERDIWANPTILDGSEIPPVVESRGAGYLVSALDGFTVQNGGRFVNGGSLVGYEWVIPGIRYGGYGGGLRLRVSSPYISNNIIQRNSMGDPFDNANKPVSGVGLYGYLSHPVIRANSFTQNESLNSFDGNGGAISLYYSMASIEYNTITENRAVLGSAIYSKFAVPRIMGNLIDNNWFYDHFTALYRGSTHGAITLLSGDDFLIERNTITRNKGAMGGGIHVGTNLAGRIQNNLIVNNAGYDPTAAGGGGMGGGIYALAPLNAVESLFITNNTFGGNTASGIFEQGGGISVSIPPPIFTPPVPIADRIVIANNLIAFNSSGIYETLTTPMVYPTLIANDLYGNGGKDYITLTSTFPAGPSDIHLDPLFVNAAGGDLHLSSNSPCVDAGNNDVVPANLNFDFGAGARIIDGNGDGIKRVDIGAYEYHAADTLAPDTAVTGGPTGTVNSTSATFTFSGSDNITLTGNLAYATYLEGYESTWSEYSASATKTYNYLTNGSYVFHAKARDEAGNDDATPATRSFVVQQLPSITVTPVSKDFLDVNVDSSASQAFTLSNGGTGDLAISLIALTGGDSGMFQVASGGSNPCANLTPTILPGTICTVVVRFVPTTEGAKTTTLRITSNAPTSPTDVALSGAGTLRSVFDDCQEEHWAEDFINTLYYSGVTGGCNDTSYCPDSPVTRAQMAVFIISAMGETPSTAATNAYFDDVAAPYAGFINRMSELGIAAGCGPRAYCPNDLLTRAQMAVFIIAAMGESGSTVAHNTNFDDIANDVFAGFINRMTELGITGGCGGRNYCPGSSTNRAMMAVFLVTAF